ncbi:MAB_1171c family putative transporter [Streptomyces sp. NPDC001709]
MTALVLKSPTIIRSWKDPNARATWFVLLFALAVFISVTHIHKINVITGVPNFAGPWTYSMITAFCGACLTMIITWREEPSSRRRRRIRWVWAIYAGVIAALWMTFLMADVPVERDYDLDTYYANTAWMREHVLLYLLGYLISTLVSAWMIWTWISHVSSRWLKAGLVCLQVGHALGLVFDAAKLIAIGARWAGTNWDYLNVSVAPAFAILGGSLIAVGFLLPVCGPFLQTWPREQATYWTLHPLARAIRRVAPSAAKARVGRFAPLDLRLMQRRQHIQDGLLRLAPYYDQDLYQRAYEAAATSHSHSQSKARRLAGAVAIRAALHAYSRQIPHNAGDEPAQISREVTSRIESISRALYWPRSVDSLLRRLTSPESVTAHA